MKKCEVISICTQKGGAAKTTIACNLAVGLVRRGKKVCCIDMDPKASLTMSLGVFNLMSVKISVAGVLSSVLCDDKISSECIITTILSRIMSTRSNLCSFFTQEVMQ